jgi:transaldolase
MKATQQLHNLGQNLWLDNITRELLTSGTLRRYIDEFSITGLTSNPTIFDLAIRNGNSYDDSIRQRTAQHKSGEDLFFELAFEDLHQAADLFRPIYDSTHGIDGFVSLEVSPLLAYDTARTIKEAAQLHAQSKRPNVLIKIPGTPEGVPAIEESTFEGVPVNVTLLFSREQYIASAEAYMRGIERRIAAGRDPKIHSVASVFISRWDKAVMGKVPESLRNRLGIAIAGRTYKSYCDLLDSSRCIAATSAVGQHRDEGSGGIGHHVCSSARRARYHQHDSGKDAACLRRSWSGQGRDAKRRRRCRTGAGRVRARGNRCSSTCGRIAA